MRVLDEVLKSVFFICYQDESGSNRFAGTGFAVMEHVEGVKNLWGYLVTAKHVILGIQEKIGVGGKVLVRLNRNDGGAEFVETKMADWKFHPDDPSVDVAVLDWLPPMDIYDYLMTPREIAVTKELAEKEHIGVGDEVVVVGLFTPHTGKNENIPIVRVGNIAMMRSGERIRSRLFGSVEAYLIESRSIGGLSGSPVIAHLAGVRWRSDGSAEQRGNTFYWLGLIHGHYDISLPEADVEVDTVDEAKINMGIAIVVPAHKVLEVIDQPELREVKVAEFERMRKS